jgi:DNA polymerase elongation subunit (family B)
LTPNGQFFRTDIQGFVPKMLEDMYNDRKKFKKMMLGAQQEYENEKDSVKRTELENKIARYNNLQLAKKVSLNSAYGAMGSQYFRFYDLRIALAVTLAGQLSIRWIENKLNGYMNSLLKTNGTDYVIASDTDSIYLGLNELVTKVYGAPDKLALPPAKVIEFMDRVCEDKIQPFIDKSYLDLATYVKAFAQKMQMKREGLSDKGIWTAKKRYILNVYNNEGVQYAEPHMKVMGLEMVKSSTPSAIREKMKATIKLIVTTDEETVQKFIEDFRNEFSQLPPEEISFPRSVNGLNTYSDSSQIYTKGTPIHVKGALLYNYLLKKHDLTKKYQVIQEGEKLKFTYLRQPNPINDTVISYPSRLPTEFRLDNYVDYDVQFQKAYLDPIKIILDCIDWKPEKTNSLESFFG